MTLLAAVMGSVVLLPAALGKLLVWMRLADKQDFFAAGVLASVVLVAVSILVSAIVCSRCRQTVRDEASVADKGGAMDV